MMDTESPFTLSYIIITEEEERIEFMVCRRCGAMIAWMPGEDEHDNQDGIGDPRVLHLEWHDKMGG